MKKKTILLSLLALGCASVGLASCDDKPTLKSISVSGQNTEFKVGDTFSSGDLVVTATFSDDSTLDVTDKVKVTQNADMSTAGSYAVIVSYEGLSTAYQISVVAPTNVESLKALLVDTSEAKLSYVKGDTISYDKLVVYGDYANSTSSVDSLKVVTDYTKSVKDSDGNAVTGAFTKVGVHKVTVSVGQVTASYNIYVSPIVAESLEDAITKGVENDGKVVSGYAKLTTSMPAYDYSYESEYTYNYGKDFTAVTQNGSTTYYSFKDETKEDVFGVIVSGDSLSPAYYPTKSNLNGPNYSDLFSYGSELDTYGINNTIASLYVKGKLTADDFEQNAYTCELCGRADTFDFSFSTMIGSYFYDIEVAIHLNEDGVIDKAGIDVKQYTEGFTENEETGVVTLDDGAQPYSIRNLSVAQELGERTEENPYSPEKMLVLSYDLTDDEGNVYDETTVYEVKAGTPLEINVTAIEPNTASFSIDQFEFEYESGVYAYYSTWTDKLVVSGSKAGEYEITIKTSFLTRVLKVKVIVPAPDSISSEVYDPSTYFFNEASTATVKAGKKLYFNPVFPENTLNGVVVTLKEEYTGVTVDNSEDNYAVTWADCWAFSATTPGTYVVVLTSEAVPTLSCELTITVVEGTPAPTPAEVLNGTYVLDGYYSYVLVFTPESDGATSGALHVEVNGRQGLVTEELTYSYENGEIVLSMSQYIYSLEIDDDGNLLLNGWDVLTKDSSQ